MHIVASLTLSQGHDRIAAMKPTPSLQKMLRRLPLSPKQAGKEYYKGNRVGSMGTINRYGNFTPDWSKIRTFVYPIHGTKNSEVRATIHRDLERQKSDPEANT
jgi:large subunit ribosomal protein L41